MGIWLCNLWKKWATVGKDSTIRQNEEPKTQGPFSRWHTYGAHLYRREGERADVIFTNPQTGAKRVIVDNNGRILHFPGIEQEAFWTKELGNPNALKPVVRFRSEFEACGDGRYCMHWQVQPDGRYWADEDGYGWESDAEIILKAYLDRDGRFTGPFHIEQVGEKKY